jgi:hypothetical protein
VTRGLTGKTEVPAMENPTNAIVAALERDWPGWQVWVIHKAVGGTIWCARRWDDERNVLNADSADELTELLEKEAGQ